MLTDWSVDRPKQAFAAVMLAMLTLAAGGMHLQFDNSEDGFFPDDPSVDLLNEIESEYRATSISFDLSMRSKPRPCLRRRPGSNWRPSKP